MFRPSITACAILLAVAAITCEPLKATAAERTGAELLPQSTVVYAEISQSKRLIETVLNHPLRKKIEALEQVQQQYKSQQYKIVQFIITMIEQKIDMKLEEAIAALTEGGVFFGLDAETQGVVLLAKARDKNTLKTIADTLIQIVRDQNEGADPFKARKYRDLPVFQLGEGVFAQMDSWLMVTNKGELAKSIADRFLDGGKSLADDQNFQSARKSIQGTPTLWGYANAELIRDNKAAKQLLREKHDNPAAELLLGGVLSDLQKAPFVTASLFFEKDRLAFNVSMPHDSAWIPERREYFFGADGKQGSEFCIIYIFQ